MKKVLLGLIVAIWGICFLWTVNTFVMILLSWAIWEDSFHNVLGISEFSYLISNIVALVVVIIGVLSISLGKEALVQGSGTKIEDYDPTDKF
ncbi:hypothetical protein HQ571_04380 [Candidatus Kuenenbacteria bacterium]|nr:hypothetical protein [Candidatus Kuenenbacteria bacterium]